MLAEFGENSRIIVNNDGCYSSYCMELEIDGLAVTTLLQSHHIQDIEGKIIFTFISSLLNLNLNNDGFCFHTLFKPLSYKCFKK